MVLYISIIMFCSSPDSAKVRLTHKEIKKVNNKLDSIEKILIKIKKNEKNYSYPKSSVTRSNNK